MSILLLSKGYFPRLKNLPMELMESGSLSMESGNASWSTTGSLLTIISPCIQKAIKINCGSCWSKKPMPRILVVIKLSNRGWQESEWTPSLGLHSSTYAKTRPTKYKSSQLGSSLRLILPWTIWLQAQLKATIETSTSGWFLPTLTQSSTANKCTSRQKKGRRSREF